MEDIYMKQVYPVIFTQLKDKKDTVLINVPDMDILTEGFGLSDAIEMARDAIGANGITLQDLGREIPVPSDISDIDIKNGTFDNDGISHVSFVDIDFDEYFDDIVGVSNYKKSNVETVLLKIDNKSIDYIRTKPLHWSQTELKNLSSTEYSYVQLKVKVNTELKMLLFSYSDAIEVLEPAWLRDTFAKKTKRMRQLYEV